MRYIVGGEAILSADEVLAIEIKFVDWLSLVLYCAVILNLNAWQTFDHVDYGIVFGVGILSHIEYQCIAFGINIRCCYNHFF